MGCRPCLRWRVRERRVSPPTRARGAARERALLVVPWPEPVARLEKLRGSLAEAVTRLVGDAGGARAGVSGRAEGVSALREAYRESARAVELGEMLDPAAAIHFYDDHVLHDLFESAPAQGDRLIAQTLEPLLRLGEAGERLIETLDAYLRSGQTQDRGRRARDPPHHAQHSRAVRRATRSTSRIRRTAADRGRAALPSPPGEGAGLTWGPALRGQNEDVLPTLRPRRARRRRATAERDDAATQASGST